MQNESISGRAEANSQQIKRPFSILRWIACFPAAILACIISRYILLFINLNGMARYDDVAPGSFMWRFYETAFGGFVMGGIFVFVASYIAPTHQRRVVIVSTALVLIVAGFGLFLSIVGANLWAICEVVCLAIGASVVAYSYWSQYDE